MVSIGMPVMNGEKYIRDALDSLLAQTYGNFEITISDNASSDGTASICREYAARDTRIRYIRQAENIGAVANFSFVLAEATGEYFMWAAYDDSWKPKFIAHALSFMQDESVGFVFPTTIVKSIHLGIYKKIPTRLFRGFEDNNRSSRVLTFANLHQYSYKCNMVYSLFRTDVLKGAVSIQDISNEFLLCMIVLGETRGKVPDEYEYYKRYPFRWPGVRKITKVNNKKIRMFEKWRDETALKAESLFPEIGAHLELIRTRHEPANYQRDFKIVEELPAFE